MSCTRCGLIHSQTLGIKARLQSGTCIKLTGFEEILFVNDCCVRMCSIYCNIYTTLVFLHEYRHFACEGLMGVLIPVGNKFHKVFLLHMNMLQYIPYMHSYTI